VRCCKSDVSAQPPIPASSSASSGKCWGWHSATTSARQPRCRASRAAAIAATQGPSLQPNLELATRTSRRPEDVQRREQRQHQDRMMNAPSMALLRAFSPLRAHQPLTWAARGCLAEQQQRAQFSQTTSRQARKKGGQKTDMRVSELALAINRVYYAAANRSHPSGDTIPPPTPHHPAPPALLAVSLSRKQSSLSPPHASHIPLSATAPSATGPSTAPGASTSANSPCSANSSSNGSTILWPPPAKLCACWMSMA
jgi:hypothetical protein